MKYEINLLPTKALIDRAEKLQSRREATIFWALITALGIVILSYIAIGVSLRLLTSTLSDQIVSQNKDRATIVEKIRALNTEVALLDAKIASTTLWTPRIPDVVRVAPKEILISRIELVESPETLVVTGTASEGSAVVAYQAALEKMPWVDHVVAPLQNFARSPEAIVTFTIFHKKLFSL